MPRSHNRSGRYEQARLHHLTDTSVRRSGAVSHTGRELHLGEVIHRSR
nr:hypothetical protein JVH1_9290 [Rhodococcus sp. JVH1]